MVMAEVPNKIYKIYTPGKVRVRVNKGYITFVDYNVMADTDLGPMYITPATLSLYNGGDRDKWQKVIVPKYENREVEVVLGFNVSITVSRLP